MKLIKKQEKKGVKSKDPKDEIKQFSRGDIDYKINEYFDLKVKHKELGKDIKELKTVIEDYMKINNLITLETNMGDLTLATKLS